MSNKVSYFQNLQKYGAVTTDRSDKRQEKKAGKTSESFNNTLMKTQNSIETKIKSKNEKLEKLKNNQGNVFQRVSSKCKDKAIKDTAGKIKLLENESQKIKQALLESNELTQKKKDGDEPTNVNHQNNDSNQHKPLRMRGIRKLISKSIEKAKEYENINAKRIEIYETKIEEVKKKIEKAKNKLAKRTSTHYEIKRAGNEVLLQQLEETKKDLETKRTKLNGVISMMTDSDSDSEGTPSSSKVTTEAAPDQQKESSAPLSTTEVEVAAPKQQKKSPAPLSTSTSTPRVEPEQQKAQLAPPLPLASEKAPKSEEGKHDSRAALLADIKCNNVKLKKPGVKKIRLKNR